LNGQTQYLVEWAGYEYADEHTWELAEIVQETDALDAWFAALANHPEAI
jgi:hypothetical protein